MRSRQPGAAPRKPFFALDAAPIANGVNKLAEILRLKPGKAAPTDYSLWWRHAPSVLGALLYYRHILLIMRPSFQKPFVAVSHPSKHAYVRTRRKRRTSSKEGRSCPSLP